MGKKIVPNKVEEEVYEKLVERAEKEGKTLTALANELLEGKSLLDDIAEDRLIRFADEQRVGASRAVSILIDFYYDHDEEEEDNARIFGLIKTAELLVRYKYPLAAAQRAVEQINESIKSEGNYNPRKDSEW